MKVPLCVAEVGEPELSAVADVLRSGWYAHGKKNEEFEERFAHYLGVKRAISLNSCTSALFLAVKAQGITGEVILPSFTFVASANAVVTAGARPIFADICYDTCCIDPAAIEAAITRRTEAIMPIHFGGQSCRMDRIMQIAEKHHLTVIEDAAETIGGEFSGRKAGSFATGCFSFFPTKNITTGEGGMLTTNDHTLADKVKALSAHGMEKGTLAREKETRPWLRAATLPGYNFRLTNILAAMGVEQMKRLEEMNDLRRQHAQYLNRELAGLEWLETPVEAPDCRHVYQMYTVKLKRNRDQFVTDLRKQGIEASVHFDPPAHLQPLYAGTEACRSPLPVTEQVTRSIATLPMFPRMTREQLDFIVRAVRAG
jgi:perosamine synthetase